MKVRARKFITLLKRSRTSLLTISRELGGLRIEANQNAER